MYSNNNEYKDRYGCYAGPNPLTSIFDTTAWCFMKDSTTCPGAQPSLIESFNLDGSRVNLPGVRACGVIGDVCDTVGRVDDSCKMTNAPLAFSKTGDFVPEDSRLPFLEQLKPEAREAFNLQQNTAPLFKMSMTEYIDAALLEFGPGPATCTDVGSFNPETGESSQNIPRCKGNFVMVLPRSWVKSDPNPISNDGYGTLKARAAALLEIIAQGEQAFPGELFNGRNWTTLSRDSMVTATPSCATPGGEIEEGTANYGDFTDVTGTKGGFPGKIWRPLADSFSGCCPGTPCLCSGKCLSQTAVGDGVQFALAKSLGKTKYKGKLAYWILSFAGEIYLTDPVGNEPTSKSLKKKKDTKKHAK